MFNEELFLDIVFSKENWKNAFCYKFSPYEKQ